MYVHARYMYPWRCVLQYQMMPLGMDNILLPSDDERRAIFESSRQRSKGEDGRRKWRRGEMEFEALMRQLDNAVGGAVRQLGINTNACTCLYLHVHVHCCCRLLTSSVTCALRGAQGYRTGHVYHEPLLKKDRRGDRLNSDVEIPPSVSSYHGHGDDGV